MHNIYAKIITPQPNTHTHTRSWWRASCACISLGVYSLMIDCCEIHFRRPFSIHQYLNQFNTLVIACQCGPCGQATAEKLRFAQFSCPFRVWIYFRHQTTKSPNDRAIGCYLNVTNVWPKYLHRLSWNWNWNWDQTKYLTTANEMHTDLAKCCLDTVFQTK